MSSSQKMALFNLGFRPFFLISGIFSILFIALWSLFYSYGWNFPSQVMTATQWHSHEMIFGYAMGVVAGFLLTAVKNWTGVQTINGLPLFVLVITWVLARVSPFIDSEQALLVTLVLNCIFLIGLLIALTIPVVKAKQWKQIGILSKIFFILVCNVLFYAGLTGYVDEGLRWGLYGGFYLILALIFMMARRVIPFFIEKGIKEKIEIRNSRLLDIVSLFIFVAFMISDIMAPDSMVTMLFAVVLFGLHSIRLYGWYCHEIWRIPMLWSLYVAYCFLVLGFALKAGVWFLALSPYLSLHAFTYGGIGLMTLGMMARVALGHTGRDITQPPSVIPWAFFIIIIGAIFRVILPIFESQYYLFWMKISQFCWILAFVLFILSYTSILLKPRIDGQKG